MSDEENFSDQEEQDQKQVSDEEKGSDDEQNENGSDDEQMENGSDDEQEEKGSDDDDEQKSGSGSDSEEGSGSEDDEKEEKKKKRRKRRNGNSGKLRDFSAEYLAETSTGDKARIGGDVGKCLSSIAQSLAGKFNEEFSACFRSDVKVKTLLPIFQRRSSVSRPRKLKDGEEPKVLTKEEKAESAKKKKARDAHRKSMPGSIELGIRGIFQNDERLRTAAMDGARNAAKSFADKSAHKQKKLPKLEKGEKRDPKDTNRMSIRMGLALNPKIAHQALKIPHKDGGFVRVPKVCVYELLGAIQAVIEFALDAADEIRRTKVVGRGSSVHHEVAKTSGNTLFAYHIVQAIKFSPVLDRIVGVLNAKPHGDAYIPESQLQMTHASAAMLRKIQQIEDEGEHVNRKMSDLLQDAKDGKFIKHSTKKKSESADKKSNSKKKKSSDSESAKKKNSAKKSSLKKKMNRKSGSTKKESAEKKKSGSNSAKKSGSGSAKKSPRRSSRLSK